MLNFHAFRFTFFLVSQFILCYFYHIVWTQTTHAFLPGLFQEYLQNTHRDWQHLDASSRMCVLPVSGNLLHVPAKHVLCSTCAGESGCWIVLLGSYTLPLLLMALPHSLLPLGRCFPALLQAGLFWHCTSYNGQLCTVAVLLILLQPSALLHLLDCDLCPGHRSHNRLTVGHVCNPSIPGCKGRSISRSGS